MPSQSADRLNDLLVASGKGDQKAFRELYEALAPMVLGVLMRMMHSRHAAEDALQEAMVSAWDRAREFDPGKSSAGTWVTSIARYRAIDQIRKTRRQARLVEEDASNISQVFGHDTHVAAIDPVSKATEQRLSACFKEITREAANCIQLAYLDGFSFSEIADKVERSIGTVKSWVRRGMLSLQECVSR